MAVKISTENNVIIFTDTSDSNKEYPYTMSSIDARYNDTEVWFEHQFGEPNLFPFLSDNGYKPQKFLFADVQDSTGASLTTKTAIQTYLSDKMGVSTSLSVEPTSYGIDVAEGNISGTSGLRQVGFNPTIGTSLEDITESGLNVVPMPDTALAMEVVSSSASDNGSIASSGTATGGSATTLIDTGATFVSDGIVAGDFVMNDTDVAHALVLTVDSETQITFEENLSLDNTFTNGDAYRIADKSAGGTGAQVMGVSALDGSFGEIEEFIVTNGTTEVPVVNDQLRTNNFRALFLGSNGVSVGNVDLRQVATPSNIMDRVAAGGNMSLQTYFTIPSGKTGYITDWNAGSDGTRAIRFILRATCELISRVHIKGVFHFQDVIVSDGAGGSHLFATPLKCPERVTIKVSGNSTGGTGTGGGGFGLDLKDN